MRRFAAAALLARAHYQEKLLFLSWLIVLTVVGAAACLYGLSLVDNAAGASLDGLLAICLLWTTTYYDAAVFG